jgi:7-cyano-7-deazaguanine synthase
LKTITILSGGMDSTTLAYYVSKAFSVTNFGHGYQDHEIEQHFLSFNYGQKHKKELAYAAMTAKELGCRHDVIDISSVTPFLKGSSLTDSVTMPKGFYAEENMRLTVVPNRNAMMLSIAWAVAVGEQADYVLYGAHAGDHFIYEDCRPEFVEALSKAFRLGTHGQYPYKIVGPFLEMDKTAILKKGIELKVPYENTWTCYNGGDLACGVCGSCQERLESFALNGVEDPLPYVTRKLIKKGESVDV